MRGAIILLVLAMAHRGVAGPAAWPQHREAAGLDRENRVQAPPDLPRIQDSGGQSRAESRDRRGLSIGGAFDDNARLVARNYTIPTEHPNTDKQNATQVCLDMDKFDSDCWDLLDITGFLQDWKRTIPLCSSVPNQNPDTCYDQDSSWSKNFLFLMTRSPDYNCDEIVSEQCSLLGVGAGANLSEPQKIKYVVRAIFASNQLFSTWWQAMSFAMTSASFEVPGMVTFLDPIKKVHETLDLILAILMVGLSLIVASELVALAAGIAAASRLAAKELKKKGNDLHTNKAELGDITPRITGKGLERVVGKDGKLLSLSDQIRKNDQDKINNDRKQAVAKGANGVALGAMVDTPFLARAIWPVHTTDSQLIQMSEILTNLSTLDVHVKKRLRDANTVMMQDFDSFINATVHGRFVSDELPTVANETSSLLVGLKNWIFTTALNGNDFQATTGPVPSDGLLTNGSDIDANFGCVLNNDNGLCTVGKGKGHQGQPKEWATYSSTITDQFYTIAKRDKDNNYKRDDKDFTMTKVINAGLSKNWTTLPLMFDASYLCQNKLSVLVDTSEPNGTVTRRALPDGVGNDTIGLYDGFDFLCVGQLRLTDGCSSDSVGSPTRWGIAKTDPMSCDSFFH